MLHASLEFLNRPGNGSNADYGNSSMNSEMLV